MKRIWAAVALIALSAGTGASAQSTPDEWTARFAGNELRVAEYDDDGRYRDFQMRMRFQPSGALQVFAEDEMVWAIWRIDRRSRLCTRGAVLSGNTLQATAEEQCLTFTITGDRIRLLFPQDIGGPLQYDGTLRPY